MFTYDLFNSKLLDNVKRVHFIGIGGSGMYPLVQILHAKGYEITGSDVLEGSIIDSERAMGIRVSLPQAAENVDGADLVVYSAAIKADNVELKAADAKGIKCVERSVLLGVVSRMYPWCFAVAGTHGKTTATGMQTTLLELSGKDPSCVIGGKLPLINGYGKAGTGKSIFVEACEYSETFLHLTPLVGFILNIDNDHLDYFGTMGKLKLAFQKFALLCKTVCFNMDDPHVMDVVNSIDRPVRSFSTKNPDAYFLADNIKEYAPGYYEFDVLRLGEYMCHMKLAVPGFHNIYNALTMACVGEVCHLTAEQIETAAASFTGTGRRFEKRGKTPSGAEVIDDYAHHPTELDATIKTAKSMGYKRVVVVHQPFTFSRTKALMDDFARVLNQADEVVLEPILGSREVNTGKVKSADLAAKLDNCVLVNSHEEAAQYVRSHCGEGDLVLCMSCGDLYKAALMMVEA